MLTCETFKTLTKFKPLNMFHVSGQQAEARPGLHEAGAAVQRTRLRDPQRVSIFSFGGGHVLKHGSCADPDICAHIIILASSKALLIAAVIASAFIAHSTAPLKTAASVKTAAGQSQRTVAAAISQAGGGGNGRRRSILPFVLDGGDC